MAQIIGPDGQTYYTEDHLKSGGSIGSNFGDGLKDSLQKGGSNLLDYLGLIGGGIAVLIGLILLADLALGLILLFFGSTSINYRLTKHRRK